MNPPVLWQSRRKHQPRLLFVPESSWIEERNPNMNEPRETHAPTAQLPETDAEPIKLADRYRQDHRHPINHFLHVGVGWPMAAVSVILLPVRPLWSLGLFLSAYAIMFFGHFVFERNIPTVFKQPSTPFVIAFSVIRGFWGSVARLAATQRTR
jgi:hypothetical protein